MCRKRPFATRRQRRRPARASVCRIPLSYPMSCIRQARVPVPCTARALRRCPRELRSTRGLKFDLTRRLRRGHSACLGNSFRAHASIVASSPASASALRTAFDSATCPLPGAALSSSFTVLAATFSACVHSATISLWSATVLSYRGIGTFRQGWRWKSRALAETYRTDLNS